MPRGAGWRNEDICEAAVAFLPILIEERFCRPLRRPVSAWIQHAISPTCFVAGGAVREAIELVMREGGWKTDDWKPKDLDVFALDKAEAERFVEACLMVKGCAKSDDGIVHRLWSVGTISNPIDLVRYEIPGADAETALRTFDFDVNSVGFDGQRLIFPYGMRDQILEGIRTRTAKVSMEHVLLRKPTRAVRRLVSLVDKGYKVPREELEAYIQNFAPAAPGNMKRAILDKSQAA